MEISSSDAMLMSLMAELTVTGQARSAKKFLAQIKSQTVRQIAKHILKMPSAEKQRKRLLADKNKPCQCKTDGDTLKAMAVGTMNWAYRRYYREWTDPKEIY